MTSNLKIVHWNANGITRKTNELSAFISTYKPDIILLNETHLKPNLSLKIPNFITYRNDLPLIRGSPAHGGTAILVHRTIVHQQININTKLQSTSILIKINNKTTLVSSVYKPPSSTLIRSDLDLLINAADNIIIAGDLNSKHPLWNSRRTNATGLILYNHLLQNDYSIVAPDTPTHFPSSKKYRPDVLDIAIVRTHLLVHVTNLNELSSDHNPILLELSDSPITVSPPTPNTQINWNKFYHTLNAEKPNTTFLTNTKKNIDNCIQAFTNSIHSALDNSSYLRNKNSRRPVIPAEIQQEINAKNRIRREWQQNRDPLIKRSLNAKIKLIRLMLQTHREDEWDKYLNSINHNENSIYKLNRGLLKKRPATHPLLGPNGLSYSAKEKSEIIADSLERQFSTFQGPNLPEVTESIAKIRGSILNKPNLFTTPGSIQKLISKLAKNKAPGRDQITNTALKFLPKNKLLDLTKIINGCFDLCYFPSIWKLSSIISIPKPGKNHQLPENYRPIALLSSLSKIYERVILQYLQKSLAGKIREEQFAFRRNHSTVLQLTKLMDKISENLNQGIQTAAIFLDVEKAFDSVCHDGLLHKMLSMNIPLQLIKITESFLSERTFSVKIENQNSSLRKANAGVPQGSCLSLTLFNIYTNDLPTNNKSRVSLFADDTMFYCSNHNARFASLQLQKQINLASDWFKTWRLRINESKTTAIMFGINDAQVNSNDYTTPGFIKDIINHLPKRKASGEDQITNNALKNAPKNFILRLTHIYNSCFRHCFFPDDWKKGQIITIPKPGKNHQDPVSYRPITLLPTIAKIFEIIILRKLKCKTEHLVRDEQFAFRHQHSTVLQLIKLTDQLCKNRNDKKFTPAIFLDVEKAFDKVWHEGLLHKLIKIGTPIHLVKLIKSFLSNRYFNVRVENSVSSNRPINAGVPQGSCLSPYLYLIYTNDIPVNVNSNLALFADDTMFYTSNRNPNYAIAALQKQVDLALTWFENWRLGINTGKTVAILFNKNTTFNLNRITMAGIPIPWSNQAKYLGVTFDKFLTFNGHVKNTLVKARRCKNMLTPVLNSHSPVPLKTKIQIYQMYIRPLLTYAAEAWGPCISRSNWKVIESVQTSCIRSSAGLLSITSNHNILNSAGLKTLREVITTNSVRLFKRNTLSVHDHIVNLGRDEAITSIKSTPKIRPFDWSHT
uniref:Putative RNA-directed DNA polymerase n=1 Tax=Schizaphis graminum TaxID=13262 RepID=A0A2S2NJB5_SCHGA